MSKVPYTVDEKLLLEQAGFIRGCGFSCVDSSSGKPKGGYGFSSANVSYRWQRTVRFSFRR